MLYLNARLFLFILLILFILLVLVLLLILFGCIFLLIPVDIFPGRHVINRCLSIGQLICSLGFSGTARSVRRTIHHGLARGLVCHCAIVLV